MYSNPAFHVSKVAAFEIGAGSPMNPEILSEEALRIYDKISHVVCVEENAVSNYAMPSHFAGKSYDSAHGLCSFSPNFKNSASSSF